MKVQRLRLRLTIDEQASETSYRHLVAALEHACESAGLHLSRAEGKRAAPQISLGAPLPQGVTSDCELVDVFLSERVHPSEAFEGLEEVLPQGIGINSVAEIGLSAPSLSSQLHWSEYEATIDAANVAVDDLRSSIDRLLAADTLPTEYRRDTKVRTYDLRPLIYDLHLEERDGWLLLAMRLCAEQDNTARADQVLLALGLPPARRIHRTHLHLEENNPAMLSFRRDGEPGEA